MEPIFGIYIAGPMTGFEFFNFPMFDKVSKKIRDEMPGNVVIFNPADHDRELLGKDSDWLPTIEDSDGSWRAWNIEGAPTLRTMLKDDLSWIAENAHMMIMLPGWENSKGANTEWALAKALGLEILYIHNNDI